MKISYVICLCLMTVYVPITLAASKCENYFEKLQNIQKLQKIGHSAAASVSLQKREKAAFEQWQDCKKGKINSKKNTKKRKSEQQKSTLQSPQKIVKLIPGSAFSANNNIVIKGKYEGLMQQAWLDYYKQPKHCYSPKNTQVFAACLEDRIKQQALFEAAYQALLKEEQ